MLMPSPNDANTSVTPSSKRKKVDKSSLETEKIIKELQQAHRRAEKERQSIKKQHQREEFLQQQKAKKARLSLERQQKKDEIEKEKEMRRLQREEEKKQRDQEKEEERLKREEERLKREEERLKREEERVKREDERRKKEAERQREEEGKNRKAQKQSAILMGFLVRPEDSKLDVQCNTPIKAGPFMQFQLKKDQRMAPFHRVSGKLLKLKRDHVDQLCKCWVSNEKTPNEACRLGLRKFGQPNYIHELRTKQFKPLSYPSTWPVEMPDVLYMGTNLNSTATRFEYGDPSYGGTIWAKVKLLQFIENYRPAYYGTWRRRSRLITGRRPFVKDLLHLDYDVDSDDEWEEEEPGESITQSDGEEEEEAGDEEDDEDEKFLVPHGYLSDDEGVDGNERAIGSTVDGEIPEMKKLRQRLSLAEYETAHKRGLQKLKPLMLGPIWFKDPLIGVQSCSENIDNIGFKSQDSRYSELEENKENIVMSQILLDVNKPIKTSITKSLSPAEHELMRSALSAYHVFLWDDKLPIVIQKPPLLETPSNRVSKQAKKKAFPDEALKYLIHLIHKNLLGKLKLQFEFRVFWEHHSTGKMPTCQKYDEYKRRGDVETPCESSAEQRSLRKASHSLGMESLSLSKYAVITKICQIAVFEDNRWAVRPDVLEQNKNDLLDLFNKSTPNSFTDINFFPPWQYVTDANLITRGMRKTVSTTASQDNTPTHLPNTPEVHSKMLSPITLPATSSCSANPRQSSSSTVTPIQHIQNKTTLVNKSPSQVASLSSSSPSLQKRTTIESFFSPPSAKRKRTSKNSIEDPIIIE